MMRFKLTKVPTLRLRHKAIVLTSLAGSVCLVSIVFVLFPNQTALRTAEAAIVDLQREQTLAGSSSRNLVIAKQRQTELQEVIAEFSQSFVAKNNPLYLIATIEEFAEGRNITANITISDTVTEESETEISGYTPVTVIVEMTGPMQAVLEFLNDISTSRLLIDVQDISIQTSPEDSAEEDSVEVEGDPSLQVQMTAVTYWK